MANTENYTFDEQQTLPERDSFEYIKQEFWSIPERTPAQQQLRDKALGRPEKPSTMSEFFQWCIDVHRCHPIKAAEYAIRAYGLGLIGNLWEDEKATTAVAEFKPPIITGRPFR
jgi:hypothetical protein